MELKNTNIERFCDEETKAYLYLSGKSRQVIGVMELGKPVRLDLTRENYLDYPETLQRVDKYILNKNVNVVPIKSLALFDKPISLDDIRKEIPNFMPPQIEMTDKLKNYIYCMKVITILIV